MRDLYSDPLVQRMRRLAMSTRDDRVWPQLAELMRGFEWFRPCTRYIVLRAAPGMPPGWMPDRLDGMWYERSRLVGSYGSLHDIASGSAKGRATGRYECRDDGYLAEVYEVGPP